MAIDINDRFIKAMDHLGHSGYSISKKLGTSEAVISNIRKKKNPPNIILVQKLLNMYLEIDPDWLLHGRGNIIRTDLPDGVNEADPNVEVKTLLFDISERMAALEKVVKSQE